MVETAAHLVDHILPQVPVAAPAHPRQLLHALLYLLYPYSRALAAFMHACHA